MNEGLSAMSGTTPGSVRRSVSLDHRTIKTSGRVFNIPLHLVTDLREIDMDDGVFAQLPTVFVRCIEYFDVHGVEEVGLYRIPGSWTTVNQLKKVFDNGGDCDLNTNTDLPVGENDVATLLKTYLRECMS